MSWSGIILVIVGGLNWLLVGAFNFDLVAALFGEMSPLSLAPAVIGFALTTTIVWRWKRSARQAAV